MKLLYTFLFSFIVLMAVPAMGQGGVIVSAAIDKNAIVIGEQARLQLKVSFPPSVTPTFFTVDSFAHFEILQQSKIDTQATENGVQLLQTITLTSWDSGSWQIPPFALQAVRNARTKPLSVQVGFSPMDPAQDYHSVKDILNIQKPGRTTWYWYVIGAILLLLLFVLLFPKKKKETVTAGPDPNAYQQALSALEKLQKENIPDSKMYFTGLIAIFRDYLHRRKGIQSHAKTTDDISLQLRKLSLQETDYKTLVDTLQLSDFVKFAKYEPSQQERGEAWAVIKKSIVAIEQTKA